MVSDPGGNLTENSGSVEVFENGAMEAPSNKTNCIGHSDSEVSCVTSKTDVKLASFLKKNSQLRCDSVRAIFKQSKGEPETLDLSNKTKRTSKPDQVETEERAFVDHLYRFMKDQGTPIERIPHLGFKQINLWKIYKAVEALGGYDSVTARRLWKNVYDELGGSPGSTSAATCTRKHYERLVLPFERQLKGEEYKPLPLPKPRKQYKKSPDIKTVKPDKKRKKLTEKEEKNNSKKTHHGRHCDSGTHVHSGHWGFIKDLPQRDCLESHKFGNCETTSLVVPESQKDMSIPLSLGPTEVISPLEKKKLLAQASLCLRQSPKVEDCSKRPSVIQCSPTPGCSQEGTSHCPSDGSPLPPSSPSVTCSRSPSPNSVSSEESLTMTEAISISPDTKKRTPSNLAVSPSPVAPNTTTLCKPQSCYPMHVSNLHIHHYHEIPQASPNQPNVTTASKNYRSSHTWSPVNQAGSSQHSLSKYPILTQSWMTSASSFKKVIPKSKDVFSPLTLSPFYKSLPQTGEPVNKIYLGSGQEFSQSNKLRLLPSLYFIDKKEKGMRFLPKPLPSLQSTQHSAVALQVPYVGSEIHLKNVHGQNAVQCPTHLPVPQLNPHQTNLMPNGSFSTPYDFSLQPYSYTLPFWPSSTGLYSYPSNGRF